jgi:hypothetical protein
VVSESTRLKSNAALPYSREGMRRLATAVKEKRLIGFFGAGVSRDLKYPDWDTFLNDLHAAVPQPMDGKERRFLERVAKSRDPLFRAEIYRQKVPTEKFEQIVRQTFRPLRRKSPLLDRLHALRLRHVVTTNYDNCAARALGPDPIVVDWNETAGITEFLRRLSYAKPQYFVHLHGSWRNPSRIILSDTDYDARYMLTDDANRKLFALFFTQALLIVGFSMRDPALDWVLRLVRAHAGSPQHFALFELESPEDEFVLTAYYERRYGITPVFYPPSDGHARLRDLLAEVAAMAGGASSAPRSLPPRSPKAQVARTGPRPVDPEDPNKGRFGGKSSVAGWTLTAEVEKTEDPDWWEVILKVTAPKSSVNGNVRFHLHPTFDRETETIRLKDGVAVLERYAYGAFTVGVEVIDKEIKLELDLAKLRRAPRKFRER